MHSMGAVEASLEATASGIAIVEKSTSYARLAQRHTVGDLHGFAVSARDTDQMLNKLDDLKKGGNP